MIEIGGLQKSTLIDYPGYLACTIFLVGCNFRCPWCYSSEIVLPDLITKQPRIDKEELFEFLEKRRGLLDGVVICGGEPTINQSLPDFIVEIKELGFRVKLDTNGSNPSMIKRLLEEELLDYIAMDIKAPLNRDKYREATGVSVDTASIVESIKTIKSSGIEYEFRTTIVPGIHTKEDIKRIADEISPAEKYYLQKFRADKNLDSSFINKTTYSDDFMIEIRDEIKGLFTLCDVRL